jgi:hypothetical protein
MYDGICPNCKYKVELSFPEDNECPNCRYSGLWEEIYNEDNYWMIWYWENEI